MSLNRLARQLRREAKANPKKAGILGLLALVAVCFWGPLVWGWWVAPEKPAVGPGTAEKEAAAEDPANPAALAYAASTSPKPSTESKDEGCPYHWVELDRWMQADPMTTPVDDVAAWPDPFAEPPSPEPVAASVAETEASPVTRESLGVDVSGTLVGPRRRVALIGGKAYREGQTVPADHSGRPIDLKLVEVHARRVVLEWEGNRFDLAIPERKSSSQIQLIEQTP